MQEERQSEIHTYQDLPKIVKKALEQANNSDKPLLIVSGENHSQEKSLFLEAMLFQVLRENNIRQVFYEFSPSVVNKFNSQLTLIKCLSWVLPKNWFDDLLDYSHERIHGHYSLMLAHELGLRTIGTDFEKDRKSTANEKADGMLYKRNKTIVNNVVNTKQAHSVLILGGCHIRDLLKYKELRNNFHIVTMNFSERSRVTFRKGTEHLAQDHDYLFSDAVLQFTVPDVIRRMSYSGILEHAKQLSLNPLTSETDKVKETYSLINSQLDTLPEKPENQEGTSLGSRQQEQPVIFRNLPLDIPAVTLLKGLIVKNGGQLKKLIEVTCTVTTVPLKTNVVQSFHTPC